MGFALGVGYCFVRMKVRRISRMFGSLYKLRDISSIFFNWLVLSLSIYFFRRDDALISTNTLLSYNDREVNAKRYYWLLYVLRYTRDGVSHAAFRTFRATSSRKFMSLRGSWIVKSVLVRRGIPTSTLQIFFLYIFTALCALIYSYFFAYTYTLYIRFPSESRLRIV